MIIRLLLLSLLAFMSCKTKSDRSLNLDFENIRNGNPTGWTSGAANEKSMYHAAVDSNIVHKGKYAVSIQFKGGNLGYSAWGYTIPERYSGKTITLSGYIKTENVSEGYAGLWMRIDPQLGFDNMSKNGIKGTSDWVKCEITLPFSSEKAEKILVGGLLAGNGKMWVDDLKITIDGEDITNAKPIEKRQGDRDTAFHWASNVHIAELDSSKIHTLYNLGLIWGFLKYYHPNISNGEYNWDNELFRIIPKLLSLTSEQEMNNMLEAWVSGFSRFNNVSGQLPFDSSKVKLSPELEWLDSPEFSTRLRGILTQIRNADRSRISNPYYIGLNASGGAVFKNERSYSYLGNPDLGYRILALYRYWNMIQYYFPYKNLIGRDWKDVLKEFIPKMVNTTNGLQYRLVLMELISTVHDSHGFVSEDSKLATYFGTRYSPLKLGFIEGKIVVVGYNNEALGEQTGLKVGDIILGVDNDSIDILIERLSKYTSASNQFSLMRDVCRKLLRSPNPTIHIKYSSAGLKRDAVVSTYPLDQVKQNSEFAVASSNFRWINKEIAYLDHGKLKSSELQSLYSTIKHAKALIIDLRNHPIDDLLFKLSDYLMPEPKSFAKFTRASITRPGLFSYTSVVQVGKYNQDYFKGRIILLVNETTQSSSEYHALAYRTHPNCTIVGSTTAGADGDVSEIILPSGFRTYISGIGVYYPDGKETQRIGIITDVKVRPTVRGIAEGKDEILEKAIQLVK